VGLLDFIFEDVPEFLFEKVPEVVFEDIPEKVEELNEKFWDALMDD